ncbi:hypothetical protein SAY86_001125 [Trapa natans]|uniref:Methyltransferase n=1 Tax=Trapa natans TaxID=22666 RepID=A0AAN7RG73_TRANT|nr:hypothetical protein SAY86_001125 [Trapa natans]
MVPFATSMSELSKYRTIIGATMITLLSLSLIFYLNSPSRTIGLSALSTSSPSRNDRSFPQPSSPPPPPPPAVLVERTGILDNTGAISNDFEVGEIDQSVLEDLGNINGGKTEETKSVEVKIERFKFCDESLRDYVPCLDNVEEIKKWNQSERGEKYERHCPKEGVKLDCLVPRPVGYQIPIPWPKSRDEQVWFNNVPHPRLAEDKGGQNWISIRNDKFIFPGGGTQFIHGAEQYLDQISKMVPDIKFGVHTRVALDVGCGVASFGAYLFGQNVSALSIAPKDVHENQIQFALERGVPAMLAVFATHRLLYPSQAFELIHCSRCRVNWTRDDGILLIEVNRLLRAGGYFIWAAQPVYKHEEILQEQWKEMQDLATRMCWKLLKKEGYIAIWQKPLNNSCYLNRKMETQPPLCDPSEDPDYVWHVSLKACITPLPENGFGSNILEWPARLRNPPERLQTIDMDGHISRKDLFRAESKYWNDIIDSYIRVYHWGDLQLQNVMDMRAGFGGFAAALYDLQVNCWVMNVVPVSGFNTLPVLYDRGLIGVMHDWYVRGLTYVFRDIKETQKIDSSYRTKFSFQIWGRE